MHPSTYTVSEDTLPETLIQARSRLEITLMAAHECRSGFITGECLLVLVCEWHWARVPGALRCKLSLREVLLDRDQGVTPLCVAGLHLKLSFNAMREDSANVTGRLGPGVSPPQLFALEGDKLLVESPSGARL